MWAVQWHKVKYGVLFWGMSSHYWVWCDCTITEEWSALDSEKFSTTAAGGQDSPSASCCSPVLSQIPLPFLQRLYHKLCPDRPCRIATNLTFFWTTEFLESGCQAWVEKPSPLRGGSKSLKDYCLASTGNSWCIQLVCRSQSDWVVTAGWNWREKQQKLGFISSRN